jgi:hypothetical protein
MSRALLYVVIVAGSAASVATSQLPDTWDITGSDTLDGAVLDDQTTVRRFRIVAERHGDAAFEDESGSVGYGLTLMGANNGSRFAQLRITLTPVLPFGPPLVELADVFPGSSEPLNVIGVAAWDTCLDDPCVEEYELAIERLEELDDPSVVITGFINGTISGRGGENEPEGTRIVMTVTELP